MNDKEIRDYLKVYEREVEKKYDDVDLEKIQLPSDFKERTKDKIISGRNDEKTTEYRKHKILKDARYSGRDIDGRKVSIAGYVGYIYEEQGERTLQWNDDKYINTIGTDDDMDESELFKMAESMY